MKKQLVIIGITLVLLSVGLSGCTDQSGGNKFVGTWTYTGGGFYYDTIHLYSDGLLSAIYYTNSNEKGTDSGTWEANDTHLTLHITSYVDVSFDYELTSSDTLVLTATTPNPIAPLGETGIYKKE